jgi:hypothetical protein
MSLDLVFVCSPHRGRQHHVANGWLKSLNRR